MSEKYTEDLYRFLRGMDTTQVFPKRIKEEEAVDEEGYVVCVCCGVSTPYKREDNVFLRINYYHGCGQFCENCEKNQRS